MEEQRRLERKKRDTETKGYGKKRKGREDKTS